MGDDGSPRPPQAYDTVSPAGVGMTTTNQVSPGTIQEILDTGDQDLIDQAFDQMGVDDMTAYVEQLPFPQRFWGRVPCGGRESSVSHPVDRGGAYPASGEFSFIVAVDSNPTELGERLLVGRGWRRG